MKAAPLRSPHLPTRMILSRAAKTAARVLLLRRKKRTASTRKPTRPRKLSVRMSINNEEIVAQGRNVFNYSATPTKISRLLDQVNQTLTATPDTKRTTEVIPAKQDKGSYTSGTYTVNHSDSLAGAEGSGTGSHKSFAEWLVGFFSGEKKDLSRDTGSFSYSYTTVSDLEAASKTQTVEKHAEADYTYKTIEVKDVDIVDTEVIVITPDDDPIPPTRPELPPVQDETPVAPEAPCCRRCRTPPRMLRCCPPT